MDEAKRVAWLALPPEEQGKESEWAKVWEPIAQTAARGTYHNVAATSEKYGCAVIGGGNFVTALWRVDLATKTMTSLPDAPHPVGIFNGSNLNTGPDGNAYILGFGEHWKLDLADNTWHQLPTPPTMFPNDHAAMFSCSTPYGIVYVQGTTANGVLDCRMWAYKTMDAPNEPRKLG